MACNFSISFTGSASVLLDKAKRAVLSQSGEFNGDDQSGTFSVSVMGKIEGNYKVNGNAIDITITDKPMFIPCSTIESVLRKQMGAE